MIDSKTMDAVIAVSEAQQDIATNSKVFKENLKLISDKKADLNKLSAKIKADRRKLDEDSKQLAVDTEAAELELGKLRRAQAKLAADRTQLKNAKDAHKVSVEELKTALQEHKSSVAQLTIDSDEFEAYRHSVTAQFAKREEAIEASEARIADIKAAING